MVEVDSVHLTDLKTLTESVESDCHPTFVKDGSIYDSLENTSAQDDSVTISSDSSITPVNITSNGIENVPIFVTNPFITPRRNVSVRDVIEREIFEECTEDAFFVADLGSIVRQHRQWKTLLPRVEPFYAIKCNSDPLVLKTLLALGTGFDCASRAEIDLVLRLGANPDRIIYANPCKQASHIQYAREHGVSMLTFDNAHELFKIKQFYPEAQIILRILADDSKSVCKFGTKFGANSSSTPFLLKTAKELGLNVIGVSFHVGSGCFDASAFEDAVYLARQVFDQGAALGYQFWLLDVGGGFPGCHSEESMEKLASSDSPPVITFPQMAGVLGPAIEKYFSSTHVRILAEPGRYYAAGAFSLAVHITSRRVMPQNVNNAREAMDHGVVPSFMYYVNDGVYGSFNCLLFDHAVVTPRILTCNGRLLCSDEDLDPGLERYDTSLWGPTCDSMDCITRHARLPELQIGDWLYFSNMGAYTVAAASTFNGFARSRIVYMNTETEF